MKGEKKKRTTGNKCCFFFVLSERKCLNSFWKCLDKSVRETNAETAFKYRKWKILWIYQFLFSIFGVNASNDCFSSGLSVAHCHHNRSSHFLMGSLILISCRNIIRVRAAFFLFARYHPSTWRMIRNRTINIGICQEVFRRSFHFDLFCDWITSASLSRFHSNSICIFLRRRFSITFVVIFIRAELSDRKVRNVIRFGLACV